MNVTASIQSAREAARRGQFHRAGTLYQQVLQQVPDDADALFGLGQLYIRLNHRVRGIEHMQRAVDLSPSADRYIALGDACLGGGETARAVTLANQAIELDPSHTAAFKLRARAQLRDRQLDAAIDSVQSSLSLLSPDTEAEVLLAEAYRRSGRLDEAEQQLTSSLTAAWDGGDRAAIMFELAMVYREQKRYSESLDALAQRGETLLQTPEAMSIDRTAQSRRLDIYQRGMDNALVTRFHDAAISAAADEPHPPPAFLVGFPRSGTTMTEQILAAHPGVVTADEQPLIHAVRVTLKQTVVGADPEDTPAQLRALAPGAVAGLRKVYWQAAERCLEESLDGRRLLDKLPLNLIHLPLINAVFPDAVILIALRDPRDVCLSCHSQRFRLNASMIHFATLESTAAFYAEVMGYWLTIRDQLTTPWIEVRYEDTVTDLRKFGGRMLDHLGLDWHDDVSRFHERAAERAISTPSYEAVREPVHRRAIGKWRQYVADEAATRPGIERIESTLRPFLKAFQYAD